jgi:hypothetical protein
VHFRAEADRESWQNSGTEAMPGKRDTQGHGTTRAPTRRDRLQQHRGRVGRGMVLGGLSGTRMVVIPPQPQARATVFKVP